jgi:ribonuclease T1
LIRFASAASLALALAAQAFAFSAIGEIRFAALPPEARDTIVLVRKGAPFAHQRDGISFGNREKILPLRERGWYREFTVKTPGARDRGARRIVAGRDGTLYYTDDHYRSFKRILE